MSELQPLMNRTVLMSDAEHFSVKELNLYSDEKKQPDMNRAKTEHALVKTAMERAGIDVIQVPSPSGCQDGIYTANWAFCSGDTAVMSRLPNVRQGEQSYARRILGEMGKRIVVPKWQRYSGQGDTLACGDTLFLGSGYRTDKEMEALLARTFPHKYRIIPIRTVPKLNKRQEPKINKLSRWPDSFFYDIDLAMGVVDQETIAWCPEAFVPESQDRIDALKDIGKIEVSLAEAMGAFACNFISTGRTVVMGAGATDLQSKIEAHGLSTVTLDTPELVKGGGFIRCISLTLDNE